MEENHLFHRVAARIQKLLVGGDGQRLSDAALGKDTLAFLKLLVAFHRRVFTSLGGNDEVTFVVMLDDDEWLRAYAVAGMRDGDFDASFNELSWELAQRTSEGFAYAAAEQIWLFEKMGLPIKLDWTDDDLVDGYIDRHGGLRVSLHHGVDVTATFDRVRSFVTDRGGDAAQAYRVYGGLMLKAGAFPEKEAS